MSVAETNRNRVPRVGRTRELKLIVMCSALVILLVYMLSGIFVVKPEQQALVVRCGKVLGDVVLPGTHYHLPYPISTVHHFEPNKVKSVAITEVLDSRMEETAKIAGWEESTFWGNAPGTGIEFITGDENIIHIVLNVQYRVSDPVQYLFRCSKPEKLVMVAAEIALTDTVARTHVDDLLTSGKHVVLARVKQRCQEDLRSWDSGIDIISTNFSSVSPPREVSDAFKDVASALEDKDRIVSEAEGDRRETLHRAQGTAQKNIKNAQGLSEGKVNRAKGEAARFQSVLADYRQSPNKDVTITRLYIESMENVLPDLGKYLIDLPASAHVEGP